MAKIADAGRRLAPAEFLLFVRLVDRSTTVGVDQAAAQVAAGLLHLGLWRRHDGVGCFVAFVRHFASGSGLFGGADVIDYGLHVYRIHGSDQIFDGDGVVLVGLIEVLFADCRHGGFGGLFCWRVRDDGPLALAGERLMLGDKFDAVAQ